MSTKLLEVNKKDHPFSASNGQFLPLGAILNEDGCHFSVYSLGCYKVELCLFDSDEVEIARYPLEIKQGNMWSIFIHSVTAAQLYGYRVYGDYQPENGRLFNEKNILIDPYARALSRVQHTFSQIQSENNDAQTVKSVAVDNAFDWQGVKKPKVEDHARILYEVDVKGFSQLK